MLVTSLLLLVFDLFFVPLMLLVSLRVQHMISVSWAVVFIPLWILDCMLLCLGFFVILFSIGSLDDAVCTIPQMLLFITFSPAATVFELLLVLKLDETVSDLMYLYVFAPLLGLELLFLCCGLTALRDKKQVLYQDIQ